MEKELIEALQELTVSVKELRHETVGGVLPEVNRQVHWDYVERVENAIERAESLLKQCRKD